ncbi:MAG: methyltransferase [Polyangiaceae bacterium]|nr:methyltransferase [Polyangiaceae bacterium]
MTSSLPADWQSAGFTPGAAHFAELCARAAGDDGDAAERALARAGLAGAEAALAALEPSTPAARAHLMRVVSRVAALHAEALRPRLLALITHPDPRVQRGSVTALGKIGGAGVEAALIAAYASAGLPEQRAIVEALGKAGSSAARDFLQASRTDDAELERRRARALLMLGRDVSRDSASGIDLDRALPQSLTVVLRARRGLAPVLLGEAHSRGRFELRSPSEVVAQWSGPLRPLFELRTALAVGLEVALGGPGDDAIVAALVGLAPTLAQLTQGVPRFRLAWQRGHQRARTFRIAQALDPGVLINDPRGALFEAQIDEGERRLVLLVRPDEDLRFGYRGRDVPAASHPTVAASLARVAGVVADDVVWDPFVGSGLELCERGLLGPFARLIGTDVSTEALGAARENLTRAGLTAELVRGDSTQSVPPGVTLVITNPPLGRRVARDGELGALFDRLIDAAAPKLAPGGRWVWLSPFPERTARRLGERGLGVERRGEVDLGGFEVELQVGRRSR